MALSDKQRGVVRGIALGLTLSLVGVLGAPFVDLVPRAEDTFAGRMTFALRWDLLLVICLIGNVGILAKQRFFTAEDIDGGGLSQGSDRARVLQSTLQNTLEQVVIAFIVYLIWAATVPVAWTASVGVAASLFVIGRLLFWRGYSGGAPSRALGFALSFYPSVVMMMVVVVGVIHGLVVSI